VKYGQTDAERAAEESLACREIVKKIVDFGVNERQKIQIMNLIALELENREDMIRITETLNMVKEGIESSPKLLT
jgi:hypothetical protein